MSELSADFSYVPGVTPYAHDDADIGERVWSPFPVAVLGLDDENLGIGKIVGAIGEAEERLPIIVIDDPYMPEGRVALTGRQCVWACLGDDKEAIIDDIAEHEAEIMLPSEYVEKLAERPTPPASGKCIRHSQSY